MLVVLSHYPGDEEQALRLATWIRDLGPYPGHELLLIADVRSTRSLAIRAEFDGARFDKIEELVNPSIIDGWPHAANFVFSMAARHIAATNSRPFLWLEPDVVPMVKGWLDKLDAEYKSGGKPFMGDYVNVENVPPHCSGIAIYPGDLIEAGAGNALIAGDIAWDCAASNQILPKLHKTKLVGHAWKHPPFNNLGELDNLRAQHPEMQIFHADKSGSAIDLLRVELKGGTQNPSIEPYNAVLEPSTAPQTPVVDILIKSFSDDADWLSYCLRGIERWANGFRKVILLYPEKEPAPVLPPEPRIPIQRIPVEEIAQGYLEQQLHKISAHEYTDAHYILHLDSDTIPFKPFSPETFFAEGKVLWLITPFSVLHTPWKEPTERFLGQEVEYEAMRRFPILAPRELYGEVGAFCLAKHGKTIKEYIRALPDKTFSEFNILGSYAFYHMHDKFTWLDTTKVEP